MKMERIPQKNNLMNTETSNIKKNNRQFKIKVTGYKKWKGRLETPEKK